MQRRARTSSSVPFSLVRLSILLLALPVACEPSPTDLQTPPDPAVASAALASLGSGTTSSSSPLAFPGAIGHGAHALASCRSLPLQVLKVRNTRTFGEGSFHQAVQDARSDRFTVISFETGGTITVFPIAIDRACVYIAGQTAPGDGVQLRRHAGLGGTVLRIDRDDSAHDIVVRYLRIRSGRGDPGRGDNIAVDGGHDLVFDHMSLQWSNDEQFGIHTVPGGTPVRQLTIQRSIIAQALRPHSTAMLIAHNPGEPRIHDLTLDHNLFAHNAHRNPRVVRAKDVIVSNNVVYNWASRVGRTVYDARVDWVGNHFRAGPWSNVRKYLQHEYKAPYQDPSVHLDRNIAEPMYSDPGADQERLMRYVRGKKNGHWLPGSAFRRAATGDLWWQPRPVGSVMDAVLADVGANMRLGCDGRPSYALDRVDEQVVRDVRDGTGPSTAHEVDHHDDFGGFPRLAEGSPCEDSDQDGMPDAFEKRFGLDRRNAADAAGDSDSDGYLNIEEYLNATDPTR